MKRIFTCFFSLLFSFQLAFGQGQGFDQDDNNPLSRQAASDTATYKKAERQKVPASFYIPTGIRIGTDLLAYGITAFGGDRERYEFQADIDFHRFYLVGSFGTSSYNTSGDEFRYSHKGNFYRIGIDVDFLKHDPDLNTFTVGLRYAGASYSEKLFTNITDDVYGPYSESFENASVNASWVELTTGLRVMILKNLYTGYTFRIQLGNSVKGATNFRSYDVPGFGKAKFKNRWTFNYYLMYRINWRKKEILPRLK